MFRFKLQSLVTLRENVEKSLKRELGVLNYQYQETEKRLQELQEAIKETCEALKKSTQGQVQISDIQHYRHYLIRQQQQEKEVKNALHLLEDKINLKKGELLEAVKERKILDNLKEMKKQEYIVEEKQQEQKIVDEIVSYKYTQKSQEETNA